MMRDYKLDTKPNRRHHDGRLRLLTAVGVLVLTFGAVRFFDLNQLPGHFVISDAAAESLSAALPLPPPKPSSREAPMPQSITVGAAEISPEADSTAAPQSLALTKRRPKVTEEQDAPSLLAAVDEPQQLPVEPSRPAAIEPTDTTETAGVEIQDASAAELLPEPEPQWMEHQITKGESLARIFAEQGLEPSLLHRIVNSSKAAKKLAQLRPGQTLRFQFDENRELSRLELHRNRVESLRIAITDDEIKTEQISKSVDRQIASTAGTIESSLFADGQKAGLSDGKIMELAGIFGWDIDFALEIRAGDQFRVLYEEHYLNGEKLRDGPILAAEFTSRGKTFRAVRYEDRHGEVGYFDDDGHSKRRAFLRTPIKFARISSRFNPKRWHPVLKRWRSHKGVDYAAPTGTPIKASGDGRVVHRGTKGGYGRTVIIQHAGKYTTLYAHMSKYSKRAKVGNRVKQGQVIGYVGRSGLASGPHLHYEFRVRGKHRDPLRVKLPKSLSLPKAEIAKFRETTAPLLAQLDLIPEATMVASSEISNRGSTTR